MTREEEIHNVSIEYVTKTHSPSINEFQTAMNIAVVKAFVAGAKWADEHPNLYNDEKYHTVKVSCLDELNRKAELYDVFLDKACEWLRRNMYEGTCDQISSKKPYPFMKDFIEDFRQAMKEE